MLAKLSDVLESAQREEVAVGAFNTPNLESILGVLNAAEVLGCPVILMHAEVHENLIPIDIIGPIMLYMAKRAKVPVCVHLDHGKSITLLEKAMKLGFTSVMYDGSLLPYEENVENTKKVVQMARKYNVSVEAEIGIINREGGQNEIYFKTMEHMYTDPMTAKIFVESTQIDALACAFGTAHGIYKEKPLLDFSRVKEISRLIKIPLVMHGGSGISFDDYQKAISSGIRKINYYTYMAKYAGEKVRDKLQEAKGIPYYHDIFALGTEAMEEHAKDVLRVFSKNTRMELS